MSREQIKEAEVLQTFTLFFTTKDAGVKVAADTITLYTSGAGLVGVVVTPIVVNPSVGEYEIDVVAPASGLLYWVMRASGAGLRPTSAQGFVQIAPLPFEIA